MGRGRVLFKQYAQPARFTITITILDKTKIGNLSINLYPHLITIRQVKYVTVIVPEKAWTGARAEYKDAYV